MSDLTARPMLLAHVQDLVNTGRSYRYSVDVYEEMVQAWITREQAFIRDRDALLAFSEEVAIDIYTNRQARGAEAIPADEVRPLAQVHHIGLENWQLTGRSLLNRTADGRRKFAHRSIMEYLIIRRFLSDKANFPKLPWTDQMTRFFWEAISATYAEQRTQPTPIDLDGVDFAALKTLTSPIIVIPDDPSRAQLRHLWPKLVIYRRVTGEVPAALNEVVERADLARSPMKSVEMFKRAIAALRKDGNPMPMMGLTPKYYNLPIYEDYITRLAWCALLGGDKLAISEIRDGGERLLHTLNTEGVGGYRSWHMPNPEEIASTVGFLAKMLGDDKCLVWVAHSGGNTICRLTLTARHPELEWVSLVKSLSPSATASVVVVSSIDDAAATASRRSQRIEEYRFFRKFQ
jgi:hypothetical protein